MDIERRSPRTVEVNGFTIRELRQRLSNPDMLEFAERVGIERSYLTKLELGQRQPSHKVFNALCDALGVHDRRVLMAQPYQVRGDLPVDAPATASAGAVA